MSSRVLLLLLMVACLAVLVTGRKSNGARSSSEREIRTRRSECEKGTCESLWDEAKALCIYRCISPECYEEIYARDEIEQGEVDTERARQFASCFRKVFKKEQDSKVGETRRESQFRR